MSETVQRLPVHNLFEWDLATQHTSVLDDPNPDSQIRIPSKKHIQQIKKSKKQEHTGESTVEQLPQRAPFDPNTKDYYEFRSIDECERVVLAHPNCAKAWVLYMVFYLTQDELEKARDIAKRALKAISLREQNERYTLCIALLNLENEYGTEESLCDAFRQSLLYNEHKVMYIHLTDIYMKNDNYTEAEKLMQTMMDRYKDDETIWMMFIEMYMKMGKSEEAHKLLDKSLRILEDKHRVDLIAKVAHLEYKFGSWEKSKIMFENMILNYPKRKDVISTYISILKKNGEEDKAEKLLPLLKKRKRQ